MACLLMRRACKVCGKHHEFFFTDGELITDRRYRYECPETGQTGYLWDIITVEAIDAPPASGVELHRMESLSGRRGAASV